MVNLNSIFSLWSKSVIIFILTHLIALWDLSLQFPGHGNYFRGSFNGFVLSEKRNHKKHIKIHIFIACGQLVSITLQQDTVQTQLNQFATHSRRRPSLALSISNLPRLRRRLTAFTPKGWTRKKWDGRGIRSKLISCLRRIMKKFKKLEPPAALGQEDGQIERQNADKLLSECGCGCGCGPNSFRSKLLS